MALVDEEPIPFHEAAKLFLGGPVCIQTMTRWARDGVGPGRAKLEFFKSRGGAMFTSREAIRRFEARRGELDAAAREFLPRECNKPMQRPERNARCEDAVRFLCSQLGLVHTDDGGLVADPSRATRGGRHAIRRA